MTVSLPLSAHDPAGPHKSAFHLLTKSAMQPEEGTRPNLKDRLGQEPTCMAMPNCKGPGLV